MANSEMLEILSKDQFDKVQEIDNIIKKLVTNINNANAAAKNFKLPSDNRNGTTSNNGNTAQGNKLLLEQKRLILQVANAKKAEALENAKLKIQVSDLNKENKKAAQEALGVLNAYQRLDAELGETRMQAKALAADMFVLEQAGQQNTEQYLKLASAYELASRRVNLLDTGIKKIDAGLGLNQRNVGNYASGFNGLGNSINQITREFPAFTFSMQTGILALSNNIPILTDEIGRLVAQNNELIAQGKPTVSIFKQIVSAVFSWQTALALGITALTIYGKEIGNFVSNLFKAKKALDAVKDSQKILNDVRVSSSKSILDEITNVKLYLQTATDEKKSLEERQIAVKKLQNEYAFYFGKLSEGQILAGDTAKAEQQINEALKARETVIGISEKYNENQSKLIDINIAIEKGIKIVTREQRVQEDIKRKSQKGTINMVVAQDLLLRSYDRENSARNANNKNQETANYLTNVNTKLVKENIEAKKVAIGLEYQPEPEQDSLDYERANDFLANRYELDRLILEGNIATNKDILENEENNYEYREQAAEAYSKNLMELAELDRAERIRVIERSTDEEIAELRRRAREGEITQANANANIFALNKQREYDLKTAAEQFSQDVTGYNKQIEQSYKDIYASLPEERRKNIELINQVANLRQMALVLDQINGGTGADGYANLENKIRGIGELESSQQVDMLRMQREEIDNEIAKIRETQNGVKANEAVAKLLNQQLGIDKQILDVELKRKKAVADLYEQMKRSTDDYLSSFTTGFLSDMGLGALANMFDTITYQIVNDLGQIETKTGSTFQKLYDQAEGLGEKTAVVFTQISEMARQAFNVLAENSRYNTEAALAQIQAEEDLAERFALTEEAKQQIQDQADEKRREARRKQAEQEKELAIFNAIIDTAQGVVAALSQGPTGIPLAALIGALGAAQIALISSREIPQFKDGVRNFGGGLAVVGDGGRSEVVRTPDGGLFRTPDTDTLVNLPKGSDVFKSDMDFLRNSGTLLGGSPHVMGDRGLSKVDMRDLMTDLTKGMATNIVTIDRKGLNAYTLGAGTRHSLFNDKVTFKSKTFKG